MTATQSYAGMDYHQVLSLHTFKQDTFMKRLRVFSRTWERKKMCSCAQDVGENEVLNCKHLELATHEKFKKEEKEIWNLSLLLIQSSRSETDSCQEWLDGLKL